MPVSPGASEISLSVGWDKRAWSAGELESSDWELIASSHLVSSTPLYLFVVITYSSPWWTWSSHHVPSQGRRRQRQRQGQRQWQ
jgi:hypothetical protein